MSITTIGATDAAACYQNANDALSGDTKPCDRALKDSQTTRADRMKTHVNRGIILNRNGALQAAIEDFNAAIAIDSGLAEAYLNRGNSWFLSGRYDQAMTDYEAALDKMVKEPWAAWYNVGLVHDARGDKNAASDAYRKALALNPDFKLARQKLDLRD
ncbi:MAG: tetratricopeptide repeat protein [Hyphococcus sp.]